MGLFSSLKKLKTGLSKTSEQLGSSIKSAVGITGERLDADALERIEEALLQADTGLTAAETILAQLEKKRFEENESAEHFVADCIKEKLNILESADGDLLQRVSEVPQPHVILMVGVNGSGKTTTTAKIAELLQNTGKTVQLAAADTFRAGAVEQLRIWAERTKTLIHTPESDKTDAAALTYQATEAAVRSDVDVLMIDTAGRLQNRADLMDELAKIRRTVLKHVSEEQITTLLVLDGTVGQNALSQMSAFRAATPLSGLIVTKLDSSAKGGILLALAAKTAPPVYFIGTGETTEDLHPFSAEAYAKSLIGIE